MNKTYYLSKSGDRTDLYLPGETIITKYPREDIILSCIYNPKTDTTTIKCAK